MFLMRGIFFFLVAVFSVQGKVYTRCELARALKKAEVPVSEIGTFICIARFESNYNTEAINRQTGDYGIFQINHVYWCNAGETPGKTCNMTCKSLLTNDISNAIKCAKIVYQETKKERGNGFAAWTTYKPHCAGNTDEYKDGCF